MATNTTQIYPAAVHSVTPALKVLRCAISYTDGATKNYVVGTVPAGAVVIRGTVVVTTAFNWGTNNLIDVGPAADPDGFATIMTLLTIGNVPLDEMATTNDQGAYTVDTIIYAQMQCTGTAASAGAGFVIIEYVENLGDSSS